MTSLCLQNRCFLQTFSLASLGQRDPGFLSSVAVSWSVFPQIHIIFQGFTVCICPLAGPQSCRAPCDLDYDFHVGGARGPRPPAPVPKPRLCIVCPSALKMQLPSPSSLAARPMHWETCRSPRHPPVTPCTPPLPVRGAVFTASRSFSLLLSLPQ